MATTPVLHLAIPARDEAARLPRALDELLPALAAAATRAGWSARVEVVDDGSRPEERAATARLVAERRACWPALAELYSLSGHAGKGAAIRASWDRALAAAAEEAAGRATAGSAGGLRWLGFVDADGAIPAGDIVRLVQAAWEVPEGRPTAVVARRERGRRGRRGLTGAIFAAWARAWLRLECRDPQAPGKCVPAGAYQAVRARLQENGWAFDVELLARLRDLGVALREVDVGWADVPGGHVRPLRDGVRLARAVLRVRRAGRGSGARAA